MSLRGRFDNNFCTAHCQYGQSFDFLEERFDFAVLAFVFCFVCFLFQDVPMLLACVLFFFKHKNIFSLFASCFLVLLVCFSLESCFFYCVLAPIKKFPPKSGSSPNPKCKLQKERTVRQEQLAQARSRIFLGASSKFLLKTLSN